jgi:tetratricopeptide (TPR) repeat protein
MMYALHCSFLGRHEKALLEARKALELDPVDPMMNFRVVQCSYYARCYQEAVDSGRTGIELSPDFPYTYSYLAQALAELSRLDEAWIIATKGRSLGGRQPLGEGVFGYLAGITGHKAEALEILEGLEARRAHAYCPATPIAWTHLGLGNTETCIDWLEIAYEEREPYLASISSFPGHDCLRRDARFKGLLRRMGFIHVSLPGGSDNR